MTQTEAFPDANEDALNKIVRDQDIAFDDTTPEDRRRQYEEQEGREVDKLPRPSDDGDDADDEDDREP
jgi:hypothetical protein